MSQRTISELTELDATPADDDELVLVDVSDDTDSDEGTSKKVTRKNLVGGLALASDLSDHEADTNNPHSVTKSQLGLGNVDNTSDATKNSAAATLTNKTILDTSNVVEEITTVTTSATPTPTGGSLKNALYITALGEAATLGAPTGTPANGNKLFIRIKDDGTGRGLSFNSVYRAIGVDLPTTTTASKTMYIAAIYNSADSKWDVVEVLEEE